MNRKKITCREAKNICINSTLKKMGFTPTKETDKDTWYLSPFRNEKTASFKVSKQWNNWRDFSEGKSGNIIDLIIKIKNVDVKSALDFLNDVTSFSFQKQKPIATEIEKTKITVKKIENFALQKYLGLRRLDLKIVKTYCKEAHYLQNNKNYFSIAFKNDLGGYELRNKYSKRCIGKKATTHFQNNSSKILVFEGFIDFLSYLTINRIREKLTDDFLILNSLSLLKKSTELLSKYSTIELYLDNDNSGKQSTNFLKREFKTVVDKSEIYTNQKDLNEYLVSYKKLPINLLTY